MSGRMLVVLFLMIIPWLTRADNARANNTDTWVLQKSTLTFHVSHPMHSVEGISRVAEGKGECQGGECNFLVSAPVKSFSSGNNGRDSRMLRVVRGTQFPTIVVRTALPESEIHSGRIQANLEIQFAGQTVQYKDVTFQLVAHGDQITLTGIIPATLPDFKVHPPKLMFVPIRNEIPVTADMTWQKQE